jgi:hypothetical protein
LSNYKKRRLWNREVQKQHITTLYKVYFIPITSTYSNQTRAAAKRNKSTIQATNTNFLTNIIARMIRGGIRKRG